MLDPEVSRACARLKNHLNMPPGPQLDALIKSAESAQSVNDLAPWIKNGLRKMNDPSVALMKDAA